MTISSIRGSAGRDEEMSRVFSWRLLVLTTHRFVYDRIPQAHGHFRLEAPVVLLTRAERRTFGRPTAAVELFPTIPATRRGSNPSLTNSRI